MISRQKIYRQYELLCQTPSDINEHLPVLFEYASKCNSVFETGVRGCVSSWALLCGLLKSSGTEKRLLLNDLTECDIREITSLCKDTEVKLGFVWQNNLTLDLKESYDLTFIDTLHCYGQLRRELAKFGPFTNKYIILHDTTGDEYRGEVYRTGDINIQLPLFMAMTGFDEMDSLNGLKLAIDEFLFANPEWILLEKLENNNGLTVLKRK